MLDSSDMPITVLLADDSEFMRRAIRRFFEIDQQIQVVAEASSFKDAIQLARELKPEAVVLDVYMGRGNSVTALEINAGLVESKVLAISFSNNDETKAIAQSFGAVEWLDKATLADELIPVIKRWMRA
jgi:DNA-binding NarL/FixJ family response regulator